MANSDIDNTTTKLAQVHLKTQLRSEEIIQSSVTLFCRYKEISDLILEKLNENETAEMYRRGQFGHLLEASKNFNLSSQIIWYLIQRQTAENEKEEFWFVIKNRPMRFSMVEYCLLTGLNCSAHFPEHTEDTSFIKRHFARKEQVKYDDIEEAFTAMEPTSTNGLNLEKVKMASVLFALFVLAPRTSTRNAQVDQKFLEMVENFDRFNQYPWGTVAYKEAIQSLKRDVTKHRTSSKQPNTIHFRGFIHPLQVLAYEYIDGLAQQFAKKITDESIVRPRMCSWKTNKWNVKRAPRLKDIVDSISEETITGGILTPTEGELNTDYFRSLQVTDDKADETLDLIATYLGKGIEVRCMENEKSTKTNKDDSDSSRKADKKPQQTPAKPTPARITRASSTRNTETTKTAEEDNESTNNKDKKKRGTRPNENTEKKAKKTKTTDEEETTTKTKGNKKPTNQRRDPRKDNATKNKQKKSQENTMRLKDHDDTIEIPEERPNKTHEKDDSETRAAKTGTENSEETDTKGPKKDSEEEDKARDGAKQRKRERASSDLQPTTRGGTHGEENQKKKKQTSELHRLQKSLNRAVEKVAQLDTTVDNELLKINNKIDDLSAGKRNEGKSSKSTQAPQRRRHSSHDSHGAPDNQAVIDHINFKARAFNKASEGIRRMGPHGTRISMFAEVQSYNFFSILSTSGRPLLHQHIDACLRGYNEMQMQSITNNRCIAFMDTKFHDLTESLGKWEDEEAMKELQRRAAGEDSEWPTLPWAKCRYVAIPIKTNEVHWALAILDYEDGIIDAVDTNPLVERYTDELTNALQNTKISLHKALIGMGLIRDTHELAINCVTTRPLSYKDTNSAIHMLRAALEIMFRDEIIEYTTPEEIEEFRKYLITSLYFNCWNWQPEDDAPLT